MSLRQIHHVDVIANAGAIGCGPVASEHGDLGPTAHGHLAHKGEEIVGAPEGVFADATGGMGADGVEVTQAADPPLFRGAGCQIIQQAFNRGFGVSVGIDRLDRCAFFDRYRLGIAVEGGAAAEHQGAASELLHRLQQAHRATHVHIPVVQRVLYGLPHGFEACEMHDGLNRA